MKHIRKWLAYFVSLVFARRRAILTLLERTSIIMASQAEHAQELRNLKDQNERNRQEVLAKIQTLQDALDNAGNTTEEVNTAMTDLKASVQAADDDVVPPVQP